jgi:hypothetical protein
MVAKSRASVDGGGGGAKNDGIAESFLRLVWGDEPLPEWARIVRWSLPEMDSTMHASVGDAARDVVRSSGRGHEAYIGVNAVRSDLRGGRGKFADVVLVSSYFIDLDVDGPGRKQSNLFKSIDECTDLLSSLPLAPTAVVMSGNGLQAWWIFREPIDVRSADLRNRVGTMSMGWTHFVIAEAKKIKRSVDSLGDITRIARVPGTFNNKYKEQRGSIPISLISAEPLRKFSLSDFEMFVASESSRPVGSMSTVEVAIDPEAQPPIEKFEVLKEIDTKFRLSWEHRRKDLKDESPSGYDFSLASIAVRAGWTDQEVANLLIARRRKHGDDLKLRENYYAKTISKARDGVIVDELQSEITTSGVTPDEDGRDKVLTLFSAMTGAQLQRVVRYMPRGDELAFHFADGRTFAISLQSLTEWMTVWRRLSAAGFYPHTRRPTIEAWLGLINGLQSIAETVEIEASGPTAEVARWALELARYSGALDGIDTPEDRRARAIVEDGAFCRGGLVWFRLNGLIRLAKEQRSRMTIGEMRHTLSALGAERRLFNARASAVVAGTERAKQVGGTCYGMALDALRKAADLDDDQCPPASAGSPPSETKASGQGVA